MINNVSGGIDNNNISKINPYSNVQGIQNGENSDEVNQLKKSGKIDCQTCKSRKYVDGSDDPGVSFKTPQGIDPSQSAAKVYSHEREHYTRESAAAQREGRKVVSNTISLKRAVCPECGRSYVAGGETRTVTRSDNQKEANKEHFREQFFNNTVGKYFGRQVDAVV